MFVTLILLILWKRRVIYVYHKNIGIINTWLCMYHVHVPVAYVVQNVRTDSKHKSTLDNTRQ